ncbi:MAG: hypothetical protein GC193_12020 [Cryomorphaceae bacterium]|nr:hypothetical protein [Cryomorphaceae bacterium]
MVTRSLPGDWQASMEMKTTDDGARTGSLQPIAEMQMTELRKKPPRRNCSTNGGDRDPSPGAQQCTQGVEEDIPRNVGFYLKTEPHFGRVHHRGRS